MKKSFLLLCALCASVIAFGQLKITPNGVFKTDNSLAGSTGTSGNSNVSFGFGALANNSSNMNTAIGYEALYANTTGYSNTANGYYALRANTIGTSNTAVGIRALSANIDGNGNTAMGSGALRYNAAGSSNTAIGVSALGGTPSKTTGSNNTAVGSGALLRNNGDYNTAIGNSALQANTTGSYNIANGYYALYTSTTGSYNTAIGYNAGVTVNNLNNTIAIGYDAKVDSSNKVVIGNSSITSAKIGTNWIITSDGRAKKNIQTNVPGLAFINRLQPVTYNFNLDALDELQKSDDPEINAFQDSIRAAQTPEEKKIIADAKASKEKIVYTGFIAQDVENAAKSIGYDFSGVDAPANGKGAYGLRYAEFVVPLVKAVQELSEQNERLQAQVNKLNAKVDELTATPSALRAAEVIIDESENNAAVAERSRSTEQQAKLYQNMPNPFNQSTQIKFYVPERVSTALLCIYDLQGKQLKQTVITQRGNGVETVYASEFTAGIYLYALIADGNQVDVKRMVLTE